MKFGAADCNELRKQKYDGQTDRWIGQKQDVSPLKWSGIVKVEFRHASENLVHKLKHSTTKTIIRVFYVYSNIG